MKLGAWSKTRGLCSLPAGLKTATASSVLTVIHLFEHIQIKKTSHLFASLI